MIKVLGNILVSSFIIDINYLFLMLRSLLPQTAPHSSARQYKELQNQIATLKAEKESLMQR
jgi:hypothetical protein